VVVIFYTDSLETLDYFNMDYLLYEAARLTFIEGAVLIFFGVIILIVAKNIFKHE